MSEVIDLTPQQWEMLKMFKAADWYNVRDFSRIWGVNQASVKKQIHEMYHKGVLIRKYVSELTDAKQQRVKYRISNVGYEILKEAESQ